MELKKLRHFIAVVDAGSLSGASEVLHITQPALTRSIKNLEAQLEAGLLERKTRGVLPTEAGARLYHQAKMILNEATRTASDIAAMARGESGCIRVGVAAMFAGEQMATILSRLAETVPGLKVDVIEGFFEELITDIKHARVEVILSNFPTGITDDSIEFEPLLNVKSHFVAGTDHPLAQKKILTMADLAEHKMAMVGRAHVSLLVADLFASEKLSLATPAIETNSLALLRSLVLSHDYVSILPDHFLSADLDGNRIVRLPVTGTPFERSAGLILRRTDSHRPAICHFISAARQVFKS
jgi:LysR family transcriptional regulator of abg operon